jgi:pseudaminic acid cytidylyltransferase
MTICIIPARKGSKRIKNKNIVKLNNIPLIGHVIKIALESKLFSKVIVSTDSKKIQSIAKKYGADVPFIRSKKLSNDFTTTRDVLIDCIKKIQAEKIKYIFCIYPTAILINKNDLIKSFKKIKKYNYDYLIAISKYNSSPLRSLKVISQKRIIFKKLKYKNLRSQDLSQEYYDTGSFYIWKTKSILKKRVKWPKKSTFYVLSNLKSVDINTKEDLDLAKLLFQNKKKFL